MSFFNDSFYLGKQEKNHREPDLVSGVISPAQHYILQEIPDAQGMVNKSIVMMKLHLSQFSSPTLNASNVARCLCKCSS